MGSTAGLTTVLFLGAAQAAFLVALVASKKGKTLSDAILGFWLLVLSAHHLLHALFSQGVSLAAAALNLNAGVPLLQGPFLYLYVETLTSGRRRLNPWDALHFAPFLGFAVYVTLLLPPVAPAHPTSVSVFDLASWFTVALLASVPAYSLAALRRLHRHDLAVLNRHSERRGRDLAWLRRIVLALLMVWGVVILAALFPWAPRSAVRHQIMGAVTLFIYAIGYFGWRQFAVAEPAEPDEPVAGTGDDSKGAPKYQRSGLRGPEIQTLVDRLKAHLEHDQPYLEPGVTLRQIADHLETTSNHLSQAINQGLGKSFYDLINEQRVEEFKRRALEPRNRHRTLLAVALDSGFSSKSSFNRVFKQLAGMSPQRYLDHQHRSPGG